MSLSTNALRCYIASPMYSSGRLMDNVRDAIQAGNQLLDHGIAVYWPQLGAFADFVEPRTESQWLELDKVWLLQCGAMLRLPGASKGADMEEAWCREYGIPVFYSVDTLLQWAKEEAVLG